LKFAKGVVSVDTGIAHMASGLGKPTIVLVCYQALNWWMKPQYDNNVTVLMGELGSGATKKKGKNYPHSLNSITPKRVIEALEARLS